MGEGDGIAGESLTAEAMGEAIKKLMQENDPLKRAALFSGLLAQLDADNAKAAFAALKETQGNGRRRFQTRGNEMQLLLNAWGRVDGASAMAELTALRDARQEGEGEEGRRGRGGGGRGPGGRGGPGGDASGEGGPMDFMSVITGWATADAEGASAYVENLGEEQRGGRLLTAGIIQGVLVNGPDAAMSFIESLPEEDGMRGRYTTMVASEMLEQGVDVARTWAEDLSDADLRSGAMASVASQYAREDLTAAVDWINQHLDDPHAAAAVTQVASEWAGQDPEAVLDWAADLPQSTQAGVFAEALDEWTERDPVAASEYLASMPASPAKDNAVQGFSTELAREDPQSAIAWAETIGDEALRAATLTQVAQTWYRRDQTAATTWLETSGLPQESIEAVQQDSGFGRGRGMGGGGRRGR